jgi:hypothetical protein
MDDCELEIDDEHELHDLWCRWFFCGPYLRISIGHQEYIIAWRNRHGWG